MSLPSWPLGSALWEKRWCPLQSFASPCVSHEHTLARTNTRAAACTHAWLHRSFFPSSSNSHIALVPLAETPHSQVPLRPLSLTSSLIQSDWFTCCAHLDCVERLLSLHSEQHTRIHTQADERVNSKTKGRIFFFFHRLRFSNAASCSATGVRCFMQKRGEKRDLIASLCAATRDVFSFSPAGVFFVFFPTPQLFFFFCHSRVYDFSSQGAAASFVPLNAIFNPERFAFDRQRCAAEFSSRPLEGTVNNGKHEADSGAFCHWTEALKESSVDVPWPAVRTQLIFKKLHALLIWKVGHTFP